MQKRVTFRHLTLPYLFILPQLAITIVFFIWPAGEAIYQSLLRQDAFDPCQGRAAASHGDPKIMQELRIDVFDQA